MIQFGHVTLPAIGMMLIPIGYILVCWHFDKLLGKAKKLRAEWRDNKRWKSLSDVERWREYSANVRRAQQLRDIWHNGGYVNFGPRSAVAYRGGAAEHIGDIHISDLHTAPICDVSEVRVGDYVSRPRQEGKRAQTQTMHFTYNPKLGDLLNYDYGSIERRILAHALRVNGKVRVNGSQCTTDDILKIYRAEDKPSMKTTLEKNDKLFTPTYKLTVDDIPAADVPKVQAAVQHAAYGIAPSLAPIPNGQYLIAHESMDELAKRIAVSLGDRITAIRLVRSCTGWGLKEGKEYVERLIGEKVPPKA